MGDDLAIGDPWRHLGLADSEIQDEIAAAVADAPVVDIQAEGGRGLMLVGALAHSWGWRSTADGKVTWAQTATP